MENENQTGDVQDERRHRLQKAMGRVEKAPNVPDALKDLELQERSLANYYGIVSERQPGFDYKMVRIGKNSHGSVSRAVSRGWKLLNGEDPELQELKNPDGLRVLSDTAWARRPMAMTVAHRQRMWEQSQKQLGDWQDHIESLGRSARSRGAREVRLIAEAPVEMVLELWRQRQLARQQAALNRRRGG